MEMEIEFLVDEKDKLKIEIAGEGHTLCNPLVKELWKDNKIEVAGYNIDHSLISNPILTIQGSNVRGSLKKAINRLSKSIKDMDEKFKNAR